MEVKIGKELHSTCNVT